VNDVYYGLKACICIKVNDLRTTGKADYLFYLQTNDFEKSWHRELLFEKCNCENQWLNYTDCVFSESGALSGWFFQYHGDDE